MSIASYWTRSHFKRRTLLLTTLGVCAILIWIGLSDYFSLKANMEARLQDRLVLAKVVAGNLEYLILENLTNLQDFSFFKGVNLQDDNPEPEKEALHAAALHSICTNVFLLDTRGEVLWIEPPRELKGSDYSKYVPVRQAIMDQKPIVSNLFEASGTQKIFLLVPVTQDGTVLGFVGGELDPSRHELRRILQNAALGATGYVEVLDGGGVILASTREEDVLRQSDHKGFLANLIKTHQPRVSACHKCHETKEQPAREIMAFAPLTGISWGVKIGQSEAEAFAPVHTMQKRYVTFGILILLFTMTVTWGTAHSVTAPIHALTQSAKRIASGNLEKQVAHSGSDEIGELGRTLDEMRAKLKESLEAIERMNVDLEERVAERTKQVRELYEELKRKEELRGELLLKILSAQEEERKRIARELHDQLSQKLTALLFALDSPSTAPPVDSSKIRNLVTDSIDSVHQLIFDLRPAVLDDLGLPAAIKWYAEDRLKPLGIQVAFENELNSHRLSNQLETVLFRIAQETISNIARHSKAENVLITIEIEDRFITLDIEDDGVGFAPDEFNQPKSGTRGLGLWGMRERALLLNGSLKIESDRGEGTRVQARFPLQELPQNGKDKSTDC